LEFSRTKDIVASSAAALVGERFIVPTIKTSQRGNFNAGEISGKTLIFMNKFGETPQPASDRSQKPGSAACNAGLLCCRRHIFTILLSKPGQAMRFL
jgi:hypothetical protein